VEWATVDADGQGPRTRRRISVFFESFERHRVGDRLIGDVRALTDTVAAKDAAIDDLRAHNTDLEDRLAQLEALVTPLVEPQD